MNLNVTVGHVAYRLLCRYTQCTLAASCIHWIVSIVACESDERTCDCSSLKWSKLKSCTADKSRLVTRGPRGEKSPYIFFLEKCVGHNLKLLDIFWKIWAPLRKLFALPGVSVVWIALNLLRQAQANYGYSGHLTNRKATSSNRAHMPCSLYYY